MKHLTIFITTDGYGPEAEERGTEYLERLHTGFCEFVARRATEDLGGRFEGFEVNVETGDPQRFVCDDSSVVLDLEGYWEEWCTTGWDEFESSVRREEYIARFPALDDAITFEIGVLSAIAKEDLPEHARAVLCDGADGPVQYWDWLIEQHEKSTPTGDNVSSGA